MILSASAETRPTPRSPLADRPWLLPALVFGWAQVILLLWWAGQWPGLLSPDSVQYLLHVTTGPWTADHSVLYDSLVLVSLKLSGNIALLTAVQTTVAAAILTYGYTSLRAWRVRARWAALPAVLLPLLPSFGAFVSTVWKDVPFAFAEMMVAVTTMRILARRRRVDGGHTISPALLTALGLECVALVLFRNDGFLVVLVVAVVLIVALRGLRLKVTMAAAAALVTFWFAGAVIYPAAHIRKASSSLSYGIFYADIAVAYAEAPNRFSAADRTLMTRMAPLSVWREADNCYSSDVLFRSGKFDLTAADHYRHQLAALWIRTFEPMPLTLVSTRLCRSSVAWSPVPPPRSKSFFSEVVQTVPDNLYGHAADFGPALSRHLRPSPLSHSLGTLTQNLRTGTNGSAWQMLIYRGATWCYVAYLVVFVLGRRLRRWDVLAIAGVSLANQLTVLAANPAQLYRYMVGPIFVGMLVVPLLAAPRTSPSQAPLDGAEPAPADATPTEVIPRVEVNPPAGPEERRPLYIR